MRNSDHSHGLLWCVGAFVVVMGCVLAILLLAPLQWIVNKVSQCNAE